jgi:hypothetical protein
MDFEGGIIMAMQQEQTVGERLARLERQNRRLTLILVCLAPVVAALVLMGFTSVEEQLQGLKNLQVRQIETERLVIRDANGFLRGWLGIAEDGTRLVFYDQNGRQRAGFGMTSQNEPALAIFDPNQQTRIVLGLADGWPGLVIRDAGGLKRIALQTQPDWATLFFFDGRERKRAGIGLAKESAAVNLLDEYSVDRAGLTVDPNGSSLVFFDRMGVKRAGLGLLKEDSPALGFFEKSGELRLGLSVLPGLAEMAVYGTNRIEAAARVTTNGPTFEIHGPERALLWKAP